jgi:F0F1-type ATP synthase membrane subunit b/b'
VKARSIAKRLARVGAWSAALVLLAPVLAAAAEGSAEPSTSEWVFRWLNFVLIFGVGGWWAGKKLKAVFRRNAEKIAATIAEAEEAKRRAAERLQAAEAKLAAIEREAAEMREQARRDSAAEAERIRALAREEAARAERAADAEIEAAERTSVNRLREMAIARTIQRARELVAERMTPAVDRRLFGRFVEALGRMGREA